MPKSRPKRTIASSSSVFYGSSPFQNDGYIKVMELVSHIVIEINHSPTATTDETRKQNKSGAESERTNHTKNKTKLSSTDRIRKWFRRHLLKEEIEILSHGKQLSSIDEDYCPSNVLVGCSRDLNKLRSFQNF
ncbi:CBM_collapsed_G0020470.mRNA.1.CDS.1 [Saccharomyces cerevisiae]|nr:CBM_collapsed_G0020470.mRNA.1.CDS.1 [Saccharomyces cerevisiae]